MNKYRNSKDIKNGLNITVQNMKQNKQVCDKTWPGEKKQDDSGRSRVQKLKIHFIRDGCFQKVFLSGKSYFYLHNHITMH